LELALLAAGLGQAEVFGLLPVRPGLEERPLERAEGLFVLVGYFD
jgi:hypothetical protein